jgi:hypothetical protein
LTSSLNTDSIIPFYFPALFLPPFPTMRIARNIIGLVITASVLFPSVAAAAPMHVNVYEKKTALVDNWKRNQSWVQGRVKLAQTNQETGEFFQSAYDANVLAIREHVNQYECYNKVNPAACRPPKK